MTNVQLLNQHEKKSTHSFCHQDVLLNAMPIPIITTNQDLTILSVNDATVKMLDMPSESILGEKYHLLFQISDTQHSECVAFEAIRRSQPVSGQATANIRGRKIPVEYGAIPVADEKGQITSVVNYLVDRSDRQLFSEEVASLQERVKSGSLDARADITNFPEPYRSALSTMNGMLDILTTPLREIEYAAYQIAQGHSPTLLTSSPDGERGELISRINELLISKSPDHGSDSSEREELSQFKIVIEMIRLDLMELGHRLQTGDFGVRIESLDYEGDFKSAVESLNEGLAYSENALNTISRFLSEIRVNKLAYG